MRDRLFSIVLLGVFGLMLAQPVSAQQPGGKANSDRKDSSQVPRFGAVQNGDQEFSIWAGGSVNSVQILARTPGATLSTLGMRYSRVIHRWTKGTLKYNAEVTLASYLTYPEFKPGRKRIDDFGSGVAPLGFQYNFRPNQKVQPFIFSSGGFLLLEKPFPDERGKKFNFTFKLGAGIQVYHGQAYGLIIGYTFHHFSNAETGQVNPGVDSNLLYIGITLL